MGSLCSENLGPVEACDAGEAAGRVEQCDPLFPECSDALYGGNNPRWGCCRHDNGGPPGLNNCEYVGFGSTAPDAACH